MLFRQGAKSRTRGRKVRSTKTKAETRVEQVRKPRADLEQQLESCRRELDEARAQQAATSEVLRVISSSPGELEPVFQAMLASATRTCEAKFGLLYRIEGDSARIISKLGIPPPLAEYLKRGPHRPPLNRLNPITPIGRVVQSRQIVHIADYRTDQAYLDRDPLTVAGIELGGIRTLLVVPMIKNDALMGAIIIFRQEVRPFTDKQIELVQNFSNQAIIAIENTRLLNELRESLQQQTAIADVVKVISRSTFDLQAVLKTLVESVAQLCDAYDSAIWRPDGDRLLLVAHHGSIPVDTLPLIRGTVAGRAVLDGRAFHIANLQTEDAEFPESSENARRWGFRSILCVPLMREGVAIGTIALRRSEVQLFTERQVALLQTFADQAVIAIENARLFEEVKARTRDLTESLAQQTATSNVLHVIYSSPGELEPVFNAILENATRICEANFGVLFRFHDDFVQATAMLGVPPAFAEFLQGGPFIPDPGSGLGRIARTKQAVHILDARAEQEVWVERDPYFVTATELSGARTLLIVPMLNEHKLVGAIAIYRQEVRAFSEKQIELVTNP
jgi:two-component system, NtrC family, sensor kinase